MEKFISINRKLLWILRGGLVNVLKKKTHIAPDTFFRSFCALVLACVNIAELHNSLCYRGITHMLHFV